MTNTLHTVSAAPAVRTEAENTAELLRRAMQRRMSARTARRSTMWAALTAEQRAAQNMRTDARYAFFAVRGDGRFHRPDCPHLHGQNHLQGFAQYGEARANGYVPCPHCNPTAELSLPLYIPAHSEARDENPQQLLADFCAEHGALLLQRADAAYLQTQSGKWKLQKNGQHLFLGHIGKAQLRRRDAGYRTLPCVFLSYTDALQYIAAESAKTAAARTRSGSFSRMPAARSKDN